MGIFTKIFRKPNQENAYVLKGKIRVGPSTKQLVRSVEPGKIVVLKHRDLDEVAAASLVEAKVKAVINTAETMSGGFSTKGPLLLLRAGIPIYEIAEAYFPVFKDHMDVKADTKFIYIDGQEIPFTAFTEDIWKPLNELAVRNIAVQLNDFIDNTLNYAMKEKQFVIKPLPDLRLKTVMAGKHVLVVVRGSGYKQDLMAIQDYIEDYRPVLIGVDGGADALLDNGFTPHLIVGDMDSISDEALKSGAEIVVHAYMDGRAPGLHRVQELGLQAQTIPSPGTSEDIAMLMAYEHNAEIIVTLGTHTHMIDFLEKGRKGMSSTMLVRMKIGSKLVDAKGVSKLYHRPVKWRNLWVVPAAALFPAAMLGMIHPGLRHSANVVWMYIKLSLLP
ncbi:MAG TPA: putative cytokinetic ring protein SteA [Bacilli bacterium]